MMYKAMCAGLLGTMMAGMTLAPLAANAQGWRDRNRDYRREEHHQERVFRNQEQRYHRSLRRDYRLDRASDHRQQTKNEWRNIAIGSGALGVLGLLNHDNTLAFAGAAGTLYSLNRYEQDRRSQAQIDRARAGYFSRPYFYRDGERFTRRTVSRNGQRYYQFYRG